MALNAHVAQLNTNLHWGGGEYQVFHLLKGLVARGVRTTLFAHPGGELMDRAVRSGLPVTPLPMSALTPMSRYHASALPALLGRGDIGLVHAHDSLAAAMAIRAKRKWGIPVILSRRVASPVRRNILSRRKYSGRTLDAVIAISETVKEVFLRTGYPADRVHVVPSGLDIEALDRVQSDGGLRREVGGAYLAGGVGSLTVKKNWQLLVRVAARLAEDGPDVQWLLVGEGPERRRLEKLAETLRVTDRVHFLGFRRDAESITKSLDLLFFTSVAEGASVTVRQAMALGVPVVAVDAAGTVESLDGHGWTVRAGDVEGAAACIRDVLRDDGRLRAVCEAARHSAVERFSLGKTVEGTMAVYAGVAAGVPGNSS